jgi:hypothetical protein
VERTPGVRRELRDMVHYETYDQSKFMSNRQVLEYLQQLRGNTRYRYHLNDAAAANAANELKPQR